LIYLLPVKKFSSWVKYAIVLLTVHQLNPSGGVMSFSQGGVMVAAGGSMDDGQDDGDEAARRRELRLLKNK
jgi:hypothetical protein